MPKILYLMVKSQIMRIEISNPKKIILQIDTKFFSEFGTEFCRILKTKKLNKIKHLHEYKI